MMPKSRSNLFFDGSVEGHDLPLIPDSSKYKTVYSPAKGIITAEPGYVIEDDASPNIQGMYIRNGEVSSDYGTVAFPTAGLLKTNKLNGSVMKIEQFVKSDATTYLCAFTTKHAYEYNTSSSTWDCISKGQTVEDCEDAWVASANVTCSVSSSIKLRGTNSASIAIGAAFTTGLAAYEDFAAKDLTNETALHFWIYSTVATSAGDLRIYLDNTSACASPLEELQIPALTANTWTPVSIDFASPASLGAIVSIGLKVHTDLGAMTVYLDDIRSTERFTGDEDDRFSTDVLNDVATITNGIDRVMQYAFVSGTGLTKPTYSLNTGALTSSEIVVAIKDHLIFFNNIENAATASQRASWTNIGSTTDLINGTAGYQDLTGDNYQIVAARKMGENRVIVYKERSIVIGEWVGGQTPFRFTPACDEQGAISKDGVIDRDGNHIVVGFDFIYKYHGGSSVTKVDDENHDAIYNSISRTYITRIFMIYDKPNNEVQFWFPTSTAYPDDIWVVELQRGAWFRRTRTMLGYGFYISQSTKTIGDLIGTIGDQNYLIGDNTSRSNTPIILLGNADGNVFQLSKSTLNNDGVAITNEFQTKDFLAGDAALQLFYRIDKFLIEAKGQSVTVDYSTDGGDSWSPVSGSNTITLNSSYDFYELDFDVVCRKIRFRFRNTSASSGFTFRFFGFRNRMRSPRR